MARYGLVMLAIGVALLGWAFSTPGQQLLASAMGGALTGHGLVILVVGLVDAWRFRR